MPESHLILERPSRSSVVALLEAQGLPTSDLTESHLQHFFFAGAVGAPDAPLSIRSTREFAGLCPASSAFMTKRL